MRTRFYLLLLLIVASLVVVPEVKAHEAVPGWYMDDDWEHDNGPLCL